MDKPMIPNVVTSALFFGAMAVLTYLQGHFSELGIPPIYAPIGAAILTAIIKMVAEWKTKVVPEASPYAGLDGQPRGAVETDTDTYWDRVLYK